ncbi:hypothetical protein RJ639_010594 [Escallonia herrerae]|uniref:Uncharacterized protein n=1 Tax=Escallonia herrerae TaxID=1293975 RepID=A0AA89AQC1_9ASTE|nr:hypothetical protein RJ639_010594 [Escallonia herrerae]
MALIRESRSRTSPEFSRDDMFEASKLRIVFETRGPSYMKERFTRIDDEKPIKEKELIEGGFKELVSLISKSTVEYEVAKEHAANIAFVSTKPFEDVAVFVGNYLGAKSNAATNN